LGLPQATALWDHADGLERLHVIDLLPVRSAESFAHWLDLHPEVEVITRDRSGLYADGGRQGAPSAVQITDRYHLVSNLGEAMERDLQQLQIDIQTLSGQFDVPFPLSWSHYVRLLTITVDAARAYYEYEALRGGWSVRDLDRQIATKAYQRLRGKSGKSVASFSPGGLNPAFMIDQELCRCSFRIPSFSGHFTRMHIINRK
jgi:transposase